MPSSPISSTTPPIDNHSNPILSDSKPHFLSGYSSPDFGANPSLAGSSGSSLILSSGSPLILSSNSSPASNSNSNSPNDEQSQSCLSVRIRSLARSVTPIASQSRSGAASMVRTPCGSSWNLSQGSKDPASQGKKKTVMAEEKTIFVDQSTGEEYKRDGTLGKGGFGRVYRVVDGSGNQYALKTYKEDVFDSEIKHELQMLKDAGENTHLVKWFGAVYDSCGSFPLFELCLPFDLFDVLSIRGRVTYPEARFFGKGIASGLAHLHKQGLIHRDLKPENVFLAPEMIVRIGDLGLSERYDSKSKSGRRVGTENYMAPEVVNSKPHTFAMDTFSLGCIMFRMILGERPKLTTWTETFPYKLSMVLKENEYHEDIDKRLIPDFKDLLEALLSFTPFTRPNPNVMFRKKFFAIGYCPDRLDESVLTTPPTFNNESKRKEMAQEEIRAI
ncbi:Serine/threonine-protein kinase plk1 [Mortierella sp. 14UC]|nr:Serine/threonine-protein kinase plk1 [Mortierella sp. 14UC]